MCEVLSPHTGAKPPPHRTPKRVVFDSMSEQGWSTTCWCTGKGGMGFTFWWQRTHVIIQKKPTLASSQVCPHTHLHLMAYAISGEEGAILESSFLHFCAGNIVTRVTVALLEWLDSMYVSLDTASSILVSMGSSL